MGNIGFINFGVDNFYLQILCLFLMFCIKHEKRKLWWLRLILSTLLGLVFFFLFPKIGPIDWWNFSFFFHICLEYICHEILLQNRN